MSVLIKSSTGNTVQEGEMASDNWKQAGNDFTAAATASLYSAQFYLGKNSNPTGNMTVKIYTQNTVPNPPTPGTLLATSDPINASTVVGGGGWVTFYFTGANQVQLNSGTSYCIELNFSGGGSASYIILYGANSGSFFYATTPGTYTSATGANFAFYLYGFVNYSVILGYAVYNLTGEATSLFSHIAHRVMSCVTGFYSLTGEAITKSLAKSISLSTGHYTLTGFKITDVFKYIIKKLRSALKGLVSLKSKIK